MMKTKQQAIKASDMIDRQAAIDAIKTWGLIDGLAEGQAIEILADEEKLPSAEPEIVRCKDCKHSRFFDPCFYCYEFGEEIIVPENGFCFMSERRIDEGN